MAISVNGHVIPQSLIKEESERLVKDLRWQQVPDPAVRARRIAEAAEMAAVNRIVLELFAQNDPRPVDSALLDREVLQQKSIGRCKSAFDESFLRKQIERQMRVGRVVQEMVAKIEKPGEEEMLGFYYAHRENFALPTSYNAAHILAGVNERQSEQEARSRIEHAWADLESGEDFATVAERHSDCKGNGGDLGTFRSGVMVSEFEDAIRELNVGERTGIFTTPFGFHIAELRARNTAEKASFDDVREDVERVLTAMREHSAYLKGLELLRSRVEIRNVADEASTEDRIHQVVASV